MFDKYNKNDQPLVSVIISTYNGMEFIDRCLHSVADQSYHNIEVICCDDCSEDGVYSKLLAWQVQDARIIVFRNSSNLKLAASLNKCLKLAGGSYIARIDDDDFMVQDRLKLQVAFLEEHLEYAMVGTDMFKFDEKGVYDIVKNKEQPVLRDLAASVCFAPSGYDDEKRSSAFCRGI